MRDIDLRAIEYGEHVTYVTLAYRTDGRDENQMEGHVRHTIQIMRDEMEKIRG